jgi:hypothetical protein
LTSEARSDANRGNGPAAAAARLADRIRIKTAARAGAATRG